MALTPRRDLRWCTILLLEKHLVIETLHDLGRTYRNGWSFGRSPPLNGVTEEGADDEEDEEEVGRQGGGREESVVGLPVEPLMVGYRNYLFQQKYFQGRCFDMFQPQSLTCECKVFCMKFGWS